MILFGIDVSKQKFDGAWLRDVDTHKVKTRTFDNTPQGFQAVLDWAIAQTQAPTDTLHFIMEATGVYHEALAYALHQAGAAVSVVNPTHLKRYAESYGRRSKTDKKDSVIIALYGASRPLRRWQPEPPSIRVLKALIARLDAVEKDIQRERNRLEKVEITQVSTVVSDSIQTVLAHLEAEKKRLLKLIDEHIDQHPDLKSDRTLLESIPAIGPVMTRYMLAMLRSRDFESASQAGAYAGLAPIHHESGTSVRGKSTIGKTGNATLRAKLYMAAVVAIRHNPAIRAQYQRIVNNGKSKMVALIAAMRKLVHICFGVLKHQTPFQAHTA